MSVKNKCLKWLVKSLPIPKHPRGEKKRILVIATTALGDTLWATPALESLRKSFPDASIAVLTSPIGEQVLRHNPWVNQTYVLRKPLWLLLSLWRALRKERFDTVLLLHASQRLI